MAIDIVNLLLEICVRKINRDVDIDLCTMIFTAELFIIVQNWKQLEITNTIRMLNKSLYFQVWEYYKGIKNHALRNM